MRRLSLQLCFNCSSQRLQHFGLFAIIFLACALSPGLSYQRGPSHSAEKRTWCLDSCWVVYIQYDRPHRQLRRTQSFPETFLINALSADIKQRFNLTQHLEGLGSCLRGKKYIPRKLQNCGNILERYLCVYVLEGSSPL